MKLMPRSKAVLMRSVTPSWLTPATVAHIPSPLPKVIAPRHISETISPVLPSFLNRMFSLHFVTAEVCARPSEAVSATQVGIPRTFAPYTVRRFECAREGDMFIVWGKTIKRRKQGFVADYCSVCRDLRTFQVKRIGSASHVY